MLKYKLPGTRLTIRRFWAPLFERYRVDIVFEHHEHCYKRTRPLKNGSVDPDGVVYIGDGSWSVYPREPKEASKVPYLATTARVRQFLKVTRTGTDRTVRAISSDNSVFDTFEQRVEPLFLYQERFLSE